MTILQCDGGYISRNLLVDNTDIDLVVGGGEECIVEENEIAHVHRYGFAGLNVGKFDGPRAGNHQGSRFWRNRIYSAPELNVNGLLGIGLLVGSRPWPLASTLTHIGDVSENESYGNVMNAFVSGVETGPGDPQGSFMNNSFGDVFGSNGFGFCGLSGIKYGVDETRLNFARVAVQLGNASTPRVNLWYEAGDCQQQ